MVYPSFGLLLQILHCIFFPFIEKCFVLAFIVKIYKLLSKLSRLFSKTQKYEKTTDRMVKEIGQKKRAIINTALFFLALYLHL